MKMNLTKCIAAGLACFATAAATPAFATTSHGVNYPAFMCTAAPGNYAAATINSSEQVANESTSLNLALLCPLLSDNSEAAVSQIGVWFYSNGLDNEYNSVSSVTAVACHVNAAGGGGACGNVADAKYSGPAGNESMTGVDTSEFSTGNFNYLLVELSPTASGYGDNTLFGYQLVYTTN